MNQPNSFVSEYLAICFFPPHRFGPALTFPTHRSRTPMRAAVRLIVLTLMTATSLVAQTAAPQPAPPPDWITSTPEASGLSAQILAQMEAAIRNGDFKHITSVLIARHGKLAYERYFEGATTATLHNTRSCTKTITSALAGIAIDRKLLPGLSTGVWPYFADKMPVQNP